MLNHPGKAPAVLFLRISALSYGVPQLARMDQALRAFFQALLPWSHCRLICGMFLKCFQRTLRSTRTARLHPSFGKRSGKNLHGFAKWDLLAGNHQGLVSGKLPNFGYFKSVSCTDPALRALGKIPALQQLSCSAQRAGNT